ncbi:MAG TPA: hypothetical protein ENK26_11955 [Gammaproteobacteria bacterium]|nr:hypothetical protein [Gammaproteobacteria bacterium]
MKRGLAAVCMLFPLSALGQEPADTPGIELLEYLGQWRDDPDESAGWTDPVELYAAGMLGGADESPRRESAPVTDKEHEAQ